MLFLKLVSGIPIDRNVVEIIKEGKHISNLLHDAPAFILKVIIVQLAKYKIWLEIFFFVKNYISFFLVYEKKFNDEDRLTINCSESCSDWVIDVRSADFGVLMKDNGPDSKPYRISLTKKDCLSSSALNVVKTYCDDRSHCLFPIRKSHFLPSPNQCGESLNLLVRYTCKIPGIVIFLMRFIMWIWHGIEIKQKEPAL